MLKLNQPAKASLRPAFGPRRLLAVRLSSSTRPSFPNSARPVTRAPTFTGPDLRPPTPYDPSKPLPPTDLPVEDYASPLLHTASFFGTLFRYAVYGSVTLVLIGVSGLAGTHLWVEYVELSSGVGAEEDDEGWSEEGEGWSGAHRGGGTDPRIGPLARLAVRGAWIASHWGGGGVASPVAPSSPFAVSGGARIGAAEAAGGGPGSAEVPDAGWRLAEQYLLYALERAGRKGILLGGAASGPASVDPAALELEQRLATLRERIGGLSSLSEAREGWERIYYALITADSSQKMERQKLLATRKLGEISARMAALSKDARDQEQLRSAAKGWYLGGLLPALSAAKELAVQEENSEGVKHVSAGSSFWSFWTRQHPKTTAPPASASGLPPVVATLVQALGAQSSSSQMYEPATQRALLRSLVALETHLALTRQLDQAFAIQQAALSFGESLLPSGSTSSLPTAASFSSKNSTTQLAHSLSSVFLATRLSLLRAHLAEVNLATSKSHSATPSSLALLNNALSTCEQTLGSIDDSKLLLDPQPLFGGRESSLRRLFGKPLRAVQRDARKTGAISAGLLAHVHESCAKGRGKNEMWCGGDEMARVFWERSAELAASGGDEMGLKQATRGAERTAQKAQK